MCDDKGDYNNYMAQFKFHVSLYLPPTLFIRGVEWEQFENWFGWIIRMANFAKTVGGKYFFYKNVILYHT
jgi:hypothetical protein